MAGRAHPGRRSHRRGRLHRCHLRADCRAAGAGHLQGCLAVLPARRAGDAGDDDRRHALPAASRPLGITPEAFRHVGLLRGRPASHVSRCHGNGSRRFQNGQPSELLPRGRGQRRPGLPRRHTRLRCPPRSPADGRNGGPLMNPIVYAVLFVFLAPIFGGLLAGIDRITSARMQSRVGPPLLQPFYDLGKLLQKDARQVNPIVEPLLIGHAALMAVTGAMLLGGTDLIFVAFVFALAALFLVLAAGSVNSPYSFAGAERELIVLLASEPFFILMLAAICKVSGESSYGGVLGSAVMVAPKLPGILHAFAFVATIKLRKSPFDISTSHHAHQELVSGLTSDMSGRLLAYVELAHWYESALLCAFVVLFFNWSVPLGLLAFVIAYGLEVLVDNSTSRAKWQLVLRSTWAVTLLFTGGNVLALFLIK